jgi:hypothetical protein
LQDLAVDIAAFKMHKEGYGFSKVFVTVKTRNKKKSKETRITLEMG